MNYQEAIIELERNHLYPALRQVAGEETICGLTLKANPHTKDDKIFLIKTVVGTNFKITWRAVDSLILIEAKQLAVSKIKPTPGKV